VVDEEACTAIQTLAAKKVGQTICKVSSDGGTKPEKGGVSRLCRTRDSRRPQAEERNRHSWEAKKRAGSKN